MYFHYRVWKSLKYCHWWLHNVIDDYIINLLCTRICIKHNTLYRLSCSGLVKSYWMIRWLWLVQKRVWAYLTSHWFILVTWLFQPTRIHLGLQPPCVYKHGSHYNLWPKTQINISLKTMHCTPQISYQSLFMILYITHLHSSVFIVYITNDVYNTWHCCCQRP